VPPSVPAAEPIWPSHAFLDAAGPIAKACFSLVSRWRFWIHRRVESIDFLDEYRIHRRLSVDFTVPDMPVIHEMASATGGPLVLPFALLSKRYLRNFDARDEAGRPIPVLTSEQNHVVALGNPRSNRQRHP